MKLLSNLKGKNVSLTSVKLVVQKNQARLLAWPAAMLLQHTVILNIVLFVILSAVALWVVSVAFYGTPHLENASSDKDRTLHIDRIDEMELWLETFAEEHVRPLQINGKVFYRTPSSPVTP